MGESAGAFSLCFHLTMPSSGGLFQRVILQSAMCDIVFDEEPKAFKQGAELVKAVGCQARKRAKGVSVLQCLRNLPADTIGPALPNRRGLLLHKVGWLQRCQNQKHVSCLVLHRTHVLAPCARGLAGFPP